MKLAAQVSQRPSRARGAGVLDRCRGSRLAGSERMYGARQRVRADHGAACRLARRRLPADRPARRSPTTSTPPSTSSNCALPESEFRPDLMAALRAAYLPGRGMATAFGVVARTGARTAWPGRLRLVRSRPPSRSRATCSCKEVSQPGQHRPHRGDAPARRWSPRGITRKPRSPTAPCRCFISTPQRAPIRIDGDKAYVGDDTMTPGAAGRRSHAPIRSTSAPTCCCVRWCRTRCSRRSVTWPDPTSSPISASSKRSTRTSAFRCR